MKRFFIVGYNISLKAYPFPDHAFIVGLDKGCLAALQAGLKLDLAYGDFDSVSEDDKEIIKAKAKDFKEVNPIKDQTDAEGAVNLFPASDEITILGGIEGKRIEHFLTNLNLIKKHPNVALEDNSSKIFLMTPQEKNQVIRKGPYKYISFFPVNDAIITLDGFSYQLDHYQLKGDDTLCISNEIEGEEGFIKIQGGNIIVIQSKDDNQVA